MITVVAVTLSATWLRSEEGQIHWDIKKVCDFFSGPLLLFKKYNLPAQALFYDSLLYQGVFNAEQ